MEGNDWILEGFAKWEERGKGRGEEADEGERVVKQCIEKRGESGEVQCGASMHTNIAMMVRMFKLKTLVDTYCLANLQEATNEARIKSKQVFTSYGNTASTSSGNKNGGGELRMEFKFYGRKVVLKGTRRFELHCILANSDLCKAIEGFLGLAGYYRNFVKGYAAIAQPLTSVLKKNAFKWSEEATLAFKELQQAMVQSPVLTLPNFEEDFIIKTDASGFGVGALLQQGGHQIAYLSKTLALKHQSLSAYEKELSTVQQGQLYQILITDDGNVMVDVEKATLFTDPVLKSAIESLQQRTVHNSKYTWTTNKLRRKGKLVVGNDKAVRLRLIAHFHSSAKVVILGYKQL
ncbi:putative mitochondrial protein [Tanacetum coccineum]